MMLIVDANGLPIGVHVEAANRHERTQVHDTLVSVFTDDVPERLIGDKADDSDALDAALAAQQIAMIAPHRRTRKRKTQDGRPLRRAKRRWKVERAFAWLQHYRRLVVRYEHYGGQFFGVRPTGVVSS
ncbi:transposase, partial [bacterium]|nr:transposase [bacterium]